MSKIEWFDRLMAAHLPSWLKAGLHEELTSVINRIHQIGDLIHRVYFDVRFESWVPAEGAPAPTLPFPIRSSSNLLRRPAWRSPMSTVRAAAITCPR